MEITVAGAIVIAGVLISFSIDRLADAIKDKKDSHESYFSPTVTDGTCQWFWDIQKMEKKK